MVDLATTQDSAASGLAYAIETAFGTVDGSVTWTTFEPNEYDDTGVETTTAPRVTMNGSGQVEKGELVDLDGKIGFSADLTQNNLRPLLPGHMSALFTSSARIAVTAVDLDTVNPDEYE